MRRTHVRYVRTRTMLDTIDGSNVAATTNVANRSSEFFLSHSRRMSECLEQKTGRENTITEIQTFFSLPVTETRTT